MKYVFKKREEKSEGTALRRHLLLSYLSFFCPLRPHANFLNISRYEVLLWATYTRHTHPIHVCVANTNGDKWALFWRTKGEQLSSCTVFTSSQNREPLPPPPRSARRARPSAAQPLRREAPTWRRRVWGDVTCVLRAPSSGKVALLHRRPVFHAKSVGAFLLRKLEAEKRPPGAAGGPGPRLPFRTGARRRRRVISEGRLGPTLACFKKKKI